MKGGRVVGREVIWQTLQHPTEKPEPNKRGEAYHR